MPSLDEKVRLAAARPLDDLTLLDMERMSQPIWPLVRERNVALRGLKHLPIAFDKA